MLAVIGALALAAPAAGAAERLSAAYELSWLGLEIGQVEVEIRRDAARYEVDLAARSTGILSVLWPFVSQSRSDGARQGVDLQPRLYAGSSRRGEEERAWSVGFLPDGRAVEIEVPAEDLAEREPVPGPLRVGPDPLSLALEAAGRAGPGVVAEGRSFDGRRVLRLALACADALEPAAATGAPALLCEVDGELLAGGMRRWQGRDGRDPERRPARAWLARGLLPDAWWPVLVEAETRWGRVTARLVRPETLPGAS
jgi:hypothetical protein